MVFTRRSPVLDMVLTYGSPVWGDCWFDLLKLWNFVPLLCCWFGLLVLLWYGPRMHFLLEKTWFGPKVLCWYGPRILYLLLIWPSCKVCSRRLNLVLECCVDSSLLSIWPSCITCSSRLLIWSSSASLMLLCCWFSSRSDCPILAASSKSFSFSCNSSTTMSTSVYVFVIADNRLPLKRDNEKVVRINRKPTDLSRPWNSLVDNRLSLSLIKRYENEQGRIHG